MLKLNCMTFVTDFSNNAESRQMFPTFPESLYFG